MGVKNLVKKAAGKAADGVAKLSALSPEQLQEMEAKRDEYFAEMPDPNDPAAVELTSRLMAANSVEVYNAYLNQLKTLYEPIVKDVEYEYAFDSVHNIRFINITKWVSDKKENSLEKLINVYEVLSNEDCNIALVFNRTITNTYVYLAVSNNDNDDNNKNSNEYIERLKAGIRGNFPGSEWKNEDGIGQIPCMKNNYDYSVATVSNIPTEKSEKFISQTIEKLLDGIIPEKKKQEYILILLATPALNINDRKLKLAEFYTALAPYASWQTDFHFNENSGVNSSATFGVNAGVSAGIQNGTNSSITNSQGTTRTTGSTDTSTETTGKTATSSETNTSSTGTSESDSTGTTETTGSSEAISESRSESNSESTTKTKGRSNSSSSTYNENRSTTSTTELHADANVLFASTGTSDSIANTSGMSWSSGKTKGTNSSVAKTTGSTITTNNGTINTITDSIANQTTKTFAKTTGEAVAKGFSSALSSSSAKSIANSVSNAVSKTASATQGISKAVNFGGNFGANFARTSNVQITMGKNEGITQSFTNYNVKHTLELLEEQMKRYEVSTALGMWDFAAYVISEDSNVANNVAHTYLALTQGESSNMSSSAVNLWRGDTVEECDAAKEICSYLRELRHPVFGLNPNIIEADATFNVYPPIVNATTDLSGKELAYSLNFPQKSISGLPIIECAEFGRNISKYDNYESGHEDIKLGTIFHMNHKENNPVLLSPNSMVSHTFISGSTGSGKSNTVYKILDELNERKVKFLVVEPAKGEYKDIYGTYDDVHVYGTNPLISPLLRINPFSFPNGIHVFEHIDRLVEIFNVCWPMYAAMPAVLKNAVQKSYEDCGWDMIKSSNQYGEKLYPCFADVARNVKEIIESSEYDAENKGAYKGSLLTRLESLTNGINGLVFTNDEIEYKDLFEENVIVDLSRVGSSETKSLLMGMMVLKLQEYRMTSADSINSSLKHVTVLEEAHNLLKRTSTETSSESGNLLGKSVEMIANAIAEMRTYGEGFIIVDQAPGLLDMAAIRNTNTKIIMRLPDQGDRDLVGKAAGLNDDQIAELAKLPKGVAAIYQNEWIMPVLCMVDKCDHDQNRYSYTYEEVELKDSEEDLIDKLYIVELLGNSTQITKEDLVEQIMPALDKFHASSYMKVIVSKLFLNPPVAPRMTKIAPIVAELFPSVVDAVRNSYLMNPSNEMDWTEAANREILNITNNNVKEQVRRDIIQCAITYYFLNELNNMTALRDWSERGNLK